MNFEAHDRNIIEETLKAENARLRTALKNLSDAAMKLVSDPRTPEFLIQPVIDAVEKSEEAIA